MPISDTGRKVLSSMQKTYGSEEKAKRVFFASINAKKPGSTKWETSGLTHAYKHQMKGKS